MEKALAASAYSPHHKFSWNNPKAKTKH